MNPASEPRLAGVITNTLPEAPEPTVALMLVSDSTVNEADWPPKKTLVAPVKFFPLIVITVPVPPVTGEKELTITGGLKY